jgi:uncharacterized protein (TIGR00369 family)
MSFDVERFMRHRFAGHGSRLGLAYRAHGPDWVEMELPWSSDLIGDVEHQVLASGPIIALMDVATSVAVWAKRGAFVPHATLDLRVDYLRPAKSGHAVIGRGECYRVTRTIAFIRGQAHDGDPDDPVAHVAGTYMSLDAQP